MSMQWFHRRSNCCNGMLLILLFWISLVDLLLIYSSNAAAASTAIQNRYLNNDTNIVKSRKEVSEGRLNSAILDYNEKFGPLPSTLRLDQGETIPFTSNSITSATINKTSTVNIDIQSQKQNILPSIGEFVKGLYYNIFNPTLRCQLGLPSTCICQESDLRRAIIRAGISFDNPTPITLCTGTITLQDSNIRSSNSKENDFLSINVTNKSFFLGCQAEERKILPKLRRRPKCVISGNGQHTIFFGNPIQLFLQNIQLINGYASLSSMNNDNTVKDGNHSNTFDITNGMGGAIHLTGGKTFIDSVTFLNNIATIGGGAIYVGPTAQLTIASANFYNNVVTGDQNNNTGNTQQQQPEIEMVYGGGAMYIDGGVVIAAKGRYEDNRVNFGYGGAVYAVEASIRLEDIEFENNVANQYGGAISVNRSISQLASTTFEINTAVGGNGNALHIGDDLDDDIDGSYVYCDPLLAVSFCYGFDDGTAIYEIPGGNHSNTNCQEVGFSDIVSERCPNYKP